MTTKEVSPEQREKLIQYWEKLRRFEIKRMFDQRYTSIKQRSSILDKHHPSSAKGLPYMSKQEFLDWCEETMDEVLPMYKEWQDGGFQVGMAPSVDRIDSKEGYVAGNIQWLSLSANIKKGNK